MTSAAAPPSAWAARPAMSTPGVAASGADDRRERVERQAADQRRPPADAIAERPVGQLAEGEAGEEGGQRRLEQAGRGLEVARRSPAAPAGTCRSTARRWPSGCPAGRAAGHRAGGCRSTGCRRSGVRAGQKTRGFEGESGERHARGRSNDCGRNRGGLSNPRVATDLVRLLKGRPRMSATVPLPKPPGAHSAREAGLYYASDADPGITRVQDRPRLRLPRRGRPARPRSRDARADPLAGDPAGVADGLDRAEGQCAPPGDRPRRARAQAVSLSPALDRGARRDQVHAHAGVRARAAGDPPPRRRRPAPRAAVARARPRHRRRAARAHADPRRQRRVRAHQRLVRLDDAARSPRRRPRPPRPLPFPRQERRDPDDRSRRTRCWRAASSAARICRARRSSSTSTRPATQRTISSTDVNDYIRDVAGRRVHGQGLPDLVGHRAGRLRAVRRHRAGIGDGAQALRVGGHRRRRRAARQHQGGVPQVLRAPDGDRCLPRRRDDRAVRPDHRARQGAGTSCPRKRRRW